MIRTVGAPAKRAERGVNPAVGTEWYEGERLGRGPREGCWQAMRGQRGGIVAPGPGGWIRNLKMRSPHPMDCKKWCTLVMSWMGAIEGILRVAIPEPGVLLTLPLSPNFLDKLKRTETIQNRKGRNLHELLKRAFQRENT